MISVSKSFFYWRNTIAVQKSMLLNPLYCNTGDELTFVNIYLWSTNVCNFVSYWVAVLQRWQYQSIIYPYIYFSFEKGESHWNLFFVVYSQRFTVLYREKVHMTYILSGEEVYGTERKLNAKINFLMLFQKWPLLKSENKMDYVFFLGWPDPWFARAHKN